MSFAASIIGTQRCPRQVRAAARAARLPDLRAAAEADAALKRGHDADAARHQDLAASYQALHDAYRQRETVFAAVMADAPVRRRAGAA